MIPDSIEWFLFVDIKIFLSETFITNTWKVHELARWKIAGQMIWQF